MGFMGQTRRKLTQEFTLAAVRRLEQGVSIAEVAEDSEVDANVLYRLGKSSAKVPAANCS